jgi:C1A family cysteine protease
MFEKDYKYRGAVRSCKADELMENSQLKDIGRVKRNSHSGLVNAVYNFGGISVGIEAGNLQDYQKGIFAKTAGQCGEQPNHAVVVVGYGDSYWIV